MLNPGITQSKGITLIELVIAMAIIGILAAVAIPAYQDNVQKAKRSDAQASLMAAMQAQERFFAERMTYTADMTDLGYSASSPKSAEGYYTLTSTACGDGIGECVLITAVGDSSTDGNLALNSLGEKTPAAKW